MNFLRRFYLEREAKRLEDRIKASPQANDFIKLIPVCVELGEQTKVDELSRRCKELFPDVEVAGVDATKPEESKSFNLSAEIEDVKLQMTEDPNPWLYGKLARLYLNMARIEAAEAVALDAQKLFSTHPYPYILLAEVCVLRNDRASASKYFDYAVKLDSQSAVSIVNLSEYYHEIRDFERTRKLLEHLLLPQRTMGSGAPPPPPVYAPTTGKSQPKAAKPREEEKIGGAKLEEKSNEALDYINKLRTIRFLQGVVITNLDGMILGVDLPFALDQDGITSAQSNLWRTSMAQAKQMMLGNYFYTAFEGASGGFLIVQVGSFVIGLLFDKRRRLDQDAQEIFDFCKQVF